MKNKAKIMGIFNITPDSFYGEKKNISIETNRLEIEKIVRADIIDIGCESSRPGAEPLSASLEIDRLDTFIPLIQDYPDIFFSIDTYKSEVAKYALKHGFKMINDITAGRNSPDMFSLASEYNVEIVLMHMQGEPRTMQINPKYDSVIENIISFFEDRVNIAMKAGIKEKNIIIDPGIGFGKTKEDNFNIIRNMKEIKKMGFKVLLGVSRKSFLDYNDKPSDRLPATLGITALLANYGVDIFRVHDVNETISMLHSVEKVTA